MSQVTLKLDAKNGILEIQADADVFDEVASRAASLLEVFSSAKDEPAPHGPPEHQDVVVASPTVAKQQTISKTKERRRRSASGSKVKNLEIVDDLLDAAQRESLKKFYSEKQPANQNELVAVVVHKLKEFTNRTDFTNDEIHTAIQALSQRTPANLRAVLGNMTSDGLGKIVDGKFVPNFKCDDLVKHDLPRKDLKLG